MPPLDFFDSQFRHFLQRLDLRRLPFVDAFLERLRLILPLIFQHLELAPVAAVQFALLPVGFVLNRLQPAAPLALHLGRHVALTPDHRAGAINPKALQRTGLAVGHGIAPGQGLHHVVEAGARHFGLNACGDHCRAERGGSLGRKPRRLTHGASSKREVRQLRCRRAGVVGEVIQRIRQQHHLLLTDAQRAPELGHGRARFLRGHVERHAHSAYVNSELPDLLPGDPCLARGCIDLREAIRRDRHLTAELQNLVLDISQTLGRVDPLHHLAHIGHALLEGDGRPCAQADGDTEAGRGSGSALPEAAVDNPLECGLGAPRCLLSPPNRRAQLLHLIGAQHLGADP